MNLRKHLSACLVVAAALGATIALLAQAPATPAPAAPKKGAPTGLFGRGAPPPSGPTPHLPDGTVDLSGVWNGGGSNSGDISKGLKAGETVSMLPWAEELMKKRLSKDDPEAN